MEKNIGISIFQAVVLKVHFFFIREFWEQKLSLDKIKFFIKIEIRSQQKTIKVYRLKTSEGFTKFFLKKKRVKKEGRHKYALI